MGECGDRLSLLVAERLRDEMRRRKMSERRLAERADVSEGTIRRALRGENISLARLGALAQALRVDAASLLTPR